MQAIREVKNVKGKTITIDLPEGFRKGKVEVIVLPYVESTKKRKNIENLLMKGPNLTDEEIKSFLTVRGDMKKWQPKEF